MNNTAKIFALVLITYLLTACQPATFAIDGVGPTTTPVPVVVPPTPAPTPIAVVESPIQQLVDAYNDTREAEGLEDIVPGLACTLYTVPTNTTSIATAVLTRVGAFTALSGINQPNCSGCGMNVLPTPIQSVYTTYFVLKCSGYIVNTDNAWHSFELTSDDGAILKINGQTVVNNDGLHSVSTAMGSVFMSDVVSPVEIDYFQGPGLMALVLQKDGQLAAPVTLYH